MCIIVKELLMGRIYILSMTMSQGVYLVLKEDINENMIN